MTGKSLLLACTCLRIKFLICCGAFFFFFLYLMAGSLVRCWHLRCCRQLATKPPKPESPIISNRLAVLNLLLCHIERGAGQSNTCLCKNVCWESTHEFLYSVGMQAAYLRGRGKHLCVQMLEDLTGRLWGREKLVLWGTLLDKLKVFSKMQVWQQNLRCCTFMHF